MKYIAATVLENRELADGHWRLELAVPAPWPEVRAGQFLTLRCEPADRYSLLRPFSILSADPRQGTIGVYYKHLGRLSTRLSAAVSGTQLDCLYPLGNGFIWKPEWRRVALVGGGVGLAPLLFLAWQLRQSAPAAIVEAFFGGATAADLVPGLLAGYDLPVLAATMDGSQGFRGTVVDLFAQTAARTAYDAVYSCGPNPMLAALKGTIPAGCPSYASLEEYMACGVGACYGCTAAVQEGAGLHHRRVCCDGPVFDLHQVEFGG